MYPLKVIQCLQQLKHYAYSPKHNNIIYLPQDKTYFSLIRKYSNKLIFFRICRIAQQNNCGFPTILYSLWHHLH